MSDSHIVAASVHSTVLEKTLEHRFLADLCSQLWLRGICDFAVSQSEVDHYGYDVIVEVGSIVRHIQLKLSHVAATARSVSVNVRLAAKPSGCVIWMFYDPATLLIDHYRWFGGDPGAPLPALGDKLAKHTKGDATGFKAPKPGHRIVAKGDLDRVEDVAALCGLLFGAS